MTFSDDVRKQVSTLMEGVNLVGVEVEDLVRIAIQQASANFYEGWERMVRENNVEGASKCYAFHEAFIVIYQGSFE